MIAMLAVFGVGHTELLILGLICCFIVLPVVVTVAVFAFLAANKADRQKSDS